MQTAGRSGANTREIDFSLSLSARILLTIAVRTYRDIRSAGPNLQPSGVGFNGFSAREEVRVPHLDKTLVNSVAKNKK